MWVKGNLHAHSNVSDGDSAPDDVCRYYSEHGYDFLSITDHNAFVDPARVDSSGLLLIPGVELSLVPEQDQGVPLHVNGLGVREFAIPERGYTRAETLQNCVDAIVSAGGIAQINHPNFYYAFDHEVMAQLKDVFLLELFNGHPLVFNEGDEEHIGVERMWDHLLTSGKRFFGTGVDDTHHYTDFAPRRANPCRGWIWARVERLSVEDVLDSLRRGEFYASTGVEITDVTTEGGELSVAVHEARGVSYTTTFIGDGRVLHESVEPQSSFALPKDVMYLRAKVTASDGGCAWTQPLSRA